ncbi:MAG TPA: iron-containing redox enzyme family protein [Conexibacter sp.]|nr:iron-containing redox enzyme family protein [Conexibacter sp.]
MSTHPVPSALAPAASVRRTVLPSARGAVSRLLLDALRQPPGTPLALPRLDASRELLLDDDVQLALYLCYELHYGALDGVDDRWEWDPGLLAFRAVLERAFEASVAELVPPRAAVAPEHVAATLRALVAAHDGPPLSRWVETQATAEQVRELLIQRSAYQLKEADPHSWAIARLAGPPKAALVEIQSDEYGGGRADRVHAVLFAKAMAALGLDPAYGAYLDALPGITLANVNLMSLLGLHRRLRGAIVGHLAAFEMTSSLPNRRYANGLRRLGWGADATDFFDEHVEADAVHEQIAAHDLGGGLATAEPELADDVVWGAAALLELEALWARHLLAAWQRGASSLRAANGAARRRSAR